MDTIDKKICIKCGIEKPIKPDFKKKNDTVCKDCKEKTIIKSYKIKLYPTKDQELMMFKIANACRFIYNWSLNKQNKHYEEVKENAEIKNKFINSFDMAKLVTRLKKEEGFEWLSDVPKTALDGAVTDCCEAFIKMFKGNSDRPRFKSKNKTKPSFLNRLDGKYPVVKVDETHVSIARVGMVRYRGQLTPRLDKYTNCRISYDGLDWWASMGIEFEKNFKDEVSINTIGIDLGVKDLAVLSTEKVYGNINKTKEIKQLEKKLKRFQRQLSRKYDDLKEGTCCKKGEKLFKTKNIIKVEKEIKKIHRKLNRKRDDYRHNLTADIIKMNPKKVVIEDLNVSGMMKNKHLSRAIAQQGFYEIKRQLEYKTKFNGIELVIADRFYPSSKTCSNCDSYKEDLKLKDRKYMCNVCGITIDRDLNAAINLSRYKK